MSNASPEKPSTLPLIAGTLGGAVSTILLYPLDLVKVRLQVFESTNSGAVASGSTTSSVGNRGGGTSMSHVVRGILRHEGFFGLYNGLTPAIVGSAASWGGYFFFYEAIKTQMLLQKKQKRRKSNISPEKVIQNDNDVKLGPMENFSAACLSGAILVGFTNPIWLIKTRMQLQMNVSQEQKTLSQTKDTSTTTANTKIKGTEKIKPPYKNMFDAARTIVKEEGFASLYKGAGPALMLVSHGGVQFVCYEFLKGHFGVYKKATRSNSGSSGRILHRLEDSLGYLTMGAMSKIVATTVTYPLQVIKSRLQQRSQTTELSLTGEVEIVKRQYNGVIDCIRRIWVNEGIIGFFKGCLPNAIRVAPSAAITFVVYESVTDMMSK